MTVADIPETGLHLDLAASPEVSAGVAALAGLREVSGLSASFDLTRRGAGAHIVGRVSAKVGQTCVVSLEPVENDIDEAIDLTFAPRPEGAGEPAKADRRRPKTDAEPPEPLINGAVDLGAIATEFLILGIDPYPRKPGVQFAPVQAETDGPHPFAALAALKKQPGGGQG